MKDVDTKKGDAVLYFFDFETKVDTRVFIPYYNMVEKVCKKCKMIPFKKDECGFVKDLDCCGK